MIDEKQSISFGYFAGGLCIFLGIIITVIGISGLKLIDFDFPGILFLMLLLSGLLLLFGGLQYILSSKKKEKLEKILNEENISIAPNATQNKTPKVAGSIVKGEWDIDEITWQQFIKNEKNYRNSDNIYFLIGFVILGTIAIILNRYAEWTTALLICLIAGVFLVLMRRSLGLNKIRSVRKRKKVLITENFVRLNEFTFILFSENRMTSSIKFLDSEIPKILEFKIHWKTRNGSTYDELRVPVPPGQEETAKNICLNFIKQNIET